MNKKTEIISSSARSSVYREAPRSFLCHRITTTLAVLLIITGFMFSFSQTFAQGTPQKIKTETFFLDGNLRSVNIGVYKWNGKEYYAGYDSSGHGTLTPYTKTEIGEDGTMIPRATSRYLGSDQQKDYIVRQQVQQRLEQTSDSIQDLWNQFLKKGESSGEKLQKGEQQGSQGTSETPKPLADKVTEQIKNQLSDQQAKTEPCHVLTPGQSQDHGNMWGEKFVYVEGKPKVDALGNRAISAGGLIPDALFKPESAANRAARMAGAGYQDDRSFNTAKNAPNLASEIPSQALDDVLKESHVQTAIREGKGKIEESDIIKPNAQDTLEYYGKNGQGGKREYQPEGSSVTVKPGTYHKGKTYKKGEASDSQDVKAEDNCTFRQATEEELQRLQNFLQGDGSGIQGGGGEYGGGGGGGGEGSQGGLLNTLLPLLGQLLGQQGQQRGQEQQGQQQRQQYACPQVYEPVCGEDGRTYPNQCVAEYQYQVRVVHQGACTEGTGDSSSVFSDLLRQATTSGVPEPLINNVIRVVVSLVISFFQGGATIGETVVE